MTLQKLSSLEEVSSHYDLFLIDLWGVVHNGIKPFSDVIPCLSQLKSKGKIVIFLTNGPRRAHVIQERLEEMGIPQNTYNFIFSSGEDVFQSFTQTKKYSSLGSKGYYLGPSKDYPFFQDLQVKETSSPQEADFILCTGPSLSDTNVTQDIALLETLLPKNIPLVCANPDRIVHLGNKSLFCAGELGHWYEKKGGTVFYHGKPYPSIYENALKQASFFEKTKILAIGDSLSTDIRGAHNAEIDSLLITSGIHKEDFFAHNDTSLSPESLTSFWASQPYHPTYILEKLC